MNFEKMIILNPSQNYKIITEIDASTSQEIDQKVALAHQSFEQWSSRSLQERIAILKNLLKAFEQKKDKIAQLIATEMGMPISVCMDIDIQVGIDFFNGYLNNAPSWLAPEIVFENKEEEHLLFFESLGVVAVSIPWNYPFTNFVWVVIQNLIVGNTVLVKHSENCVLMTQLLEEIVQASDLPAGVCNFVYGKGHDVGNYLMNSDIDMIWFTGSVATGHHLYQVAAEKDIPVILELGGSAPAIVFEDVDIDTIVESIYLYRFINNGQTCDGIKRLIVHESIFEIMVEKLSLLVSKKTVGSALNQETDLGPLANKKQLEILQDQVADAQDKGAQIICSGRQAEHLSGAYFLPTIITNISSDMKIWTEEVFGPVLPVVSFKTEDEAINLANDTIFGLGGYVYTSDKNRAINVAKKLKVGNVSINGANYNIATDPFGGYKKSGIGKTHGRIGIQSLCRVKLVAALK